MRLILQLLLPLLAATTTAFAQEPATSPPPASTFFARAQVRDFKLSPSGLRLALTTVTASKRISIVIVDLSDHNKLYAAGMSDADVVSFDWVNDERIVFSVRDLKAAGADARTDAPGLFSVKYNGERIRELVRTNAPFVRAGATYDNMLEWNHELIAVPQRQAGVNADSVIVGKLFFKKDNFDSMSPIWLNTSTGTSIDMDVAGKVPEGARRWWFDSAGHPRAIYAQHDGMGAYYWQGPGQTDWRLLTQASALEMPFEIISVDDKGQLFVGVARGAGGAEVLTRFDFEHNAPAEKALVSIPGFDFEGGLVAGAPGQGVIGVNLDADAETTVWFDRAMRDFQNEVNGKLPGHINRIECSLCGTPGMVAAVLSYSDRDPGTLYVYSAADKRWQRLMPVMKDIDPRRMANVDFQRIKARDGQDLPVWLTLPQGVKPGQPAPTVVMVHGGPWVRIGHWRWDAMNQFLASRGYLVIEPEFRGSEGYGDNHFRAGFKQWGQAMEDDLADALQWAEKQGLATPGKACIMGGSYGGYAALMGPVRYPKAFRCVVASAAVADLELFLQGSWWIADDVSGEGRSYELPKMVGDVKTDGAMLRANSPVLLAAQMKAPVLLVHGEEDQRVPLNHFKRMRDALKAAGNPPEIQTYPDEGHGWADTANQIDYAQRVEAFLAKNLK